MTWMWQDKNREEEREMGCGRNRMHSVLKQKEESHILSVQLNFSCEPPQEPLMSQLWVHFPYGGEQSDKGNDNWEFFELGLN